MLGVPGQGRNKQVGKSQYRMIDPESLLLLTTELGRYDARLFDEVLNWLRQHGKLINIQRLKGVRAMHSYGNIEVLSAMAATLLENKRLAKWSAIAGLSEGKEGDRPLFLESDGSSQPAFGEGDTVFKRFGYFRGPQSEGREVVKPRIKEPDLLLVKLRALLGVNARSEIIASLLSLQTTNPSHLAKSIAYTARSIQDVLNEMALSGHVVTSRPPNSREKYFSLRPGDWSFLITWEGAKYPQWIDWAVLFSFLEESIRVLFSPDLKEASELMTALRFREVFDKHYPILTEAGLGASFQGSSREIGSGFLKVFLEELKEF